MSVGSDDGGQTTERRATGTGWHAVSLWHLPARAIFMPARSLCLHVFAVLVLLRYARHGCAQQPFRGCNNDMPRPQSPPQLLAMWPFDITTNRCSSRMHHMTATRFAFTLPSLLLPRAVASLVHALLTKHNIKPISYNATSPCAHLSHKSVCNHTSTWLPGFAHTSAAPHNQHVQFLSHLRARGSKHFISGKFLGD